MLVYTAKYKSLEKKVWPVNVAIPKHHNPLWRSPIMSRDPYGLPLKVHPPERTQECPCGGACRKRWFFSRFFGENQVRAWPKKRSFFLANLDQCAWRERGVFSCDTLIYVTWKVTFWSFLTSWGLGFCLCVVLYKTLRWLVVTSETQAFNFNLQGPEIKTALIYLTTYHHIHLLLNLLKLYQVLKRETRWKMLCFVQTLQKILNLCDHCPGLQEGSRQDVIFKKFSDQSLTTRKGSGTPLMALLMPCLVKTISNNIYWKGPLDFRWGLNGPGKLKRSRLGSRFWKAGYSQAGEYHNWANRPQKWVNLFLHIRIDDKVRLMWINLN